MMKMLLRRVSLLMAIVLSSLIVNAQERTITGTVNDEAGGSLPGATVLVKGTTIGALSDANGKYTIKVPANATALVFSYIGMDRQDVTIGNQKVINITLRSQAVNLANVVVIGYGAVRKSEVT